MPWLLFAQSVLAVVGWTGIPALGFFWGAKARDPRLCLAVGLLGAAWLLAYSLITIQAAHVYYTPGGRK